jgi:hypothetical protein
VRTTGGLRQELGRNGPGTPGSTCCSGCTRGGSGGRLFGDPPGAAQVVLEPKSSTTAMTCVSARSATDVELWRRSPTPQVGSATRREQREWRMSRPEVPLIPCLSSVGPAGGKLTATVQSIESQPLVLRSRGIRVLCGQAENDIKTRCQFPNSGPFQWSKFHRHSVASRLIAKSSIEAISVISGFAFHEKLGRPVPLALEPNLVVNMRRLSSRITHRLERAEIILATGAGQKAPWKLASNLARLGRSAR